MRSNGLWKKLSEIGFEQNRSKYFQYGGSKQSSGDTFGRLGGERIASQYVYHLSFVASKPARLDLDARSSSPYPGSHKMEGCVERFGQGTDRAGDESSLSLGNSVEQL